MLGLKISFYLTLFLFSFLVSLVNGAELSSSTTVQANKTTLIETKNCPQCDLSGADLNRLELSGANLEGANLSRAKMSLTNLSGANLKNSDLREAVLNGADLADIDLRGADLTGASIVGAYMNGALMDGEMLETTPYADDEGLKDVKESVYVEDTEKSKAPPETEEMTIASRRDFEETPPAVPVVINQDKPVQPVESSRNISSRDEDESLPRQSVAAPDAKVAPAIQGVRIEDAVAEKEVTLSVETANQETSIVEREQADIDNDAVGEDKAVEKVFAEQLEAEEVAQEEIPVPVEEVSAAEETISTQVLSDTIAKERTGESIPTERADEKNVETVSPDDKETGIVQTMLNVFSSQEPSTEVMKNVAILLDRNNCYGCDLSGVDLSGKNFEDADLEGANLSNSNLKGADLEGANLKGANFSGADLSGADLSEADLYKAILSNADLTDANLESTLLDDVDLSEVKGYKHQAVMLMEQN